MLTLPFSTNSGPIAPNVNPPLTFTGPDAIQVFGTLATDSQSSSIVTGLGAYETVGPGTVGFNYSSTTNTFNSATVSPTVSQTSPPVFGFDATVVYHYTVPEPGTWALMVLGGTVLMTLRRRR